MSIERFNQLRSEPETLHLSEMELGEQGETWRFDYRRDITELDQYRLDQYIAGSRGTDKDIVSPLYFAFFLRGGKNFKINPQDWEQCLEYLRNTDLEKDWGPYASALKMIAQPELGQHVGIATIEFGSVIANIKSHWNEARKGYQEYGSLHSLPSLLTAWVRGKILFGGQDPAPEYKLKPEDAEDIQKYFDDDVEHLFNTLPLNASVDTGDHWDRMAGRATVMLAAHARLLGTKKLQLNIPDKFWSVSRALLEVMRQQMEYDEIHPDNSRHEDGASASHFFGLAANLAILSAEECRINSKGNLVYIPNTAGHEAQQAPATLPTRLKFPQ